MAAPPIDPGTVRARAPLRLGLAGGGTDVSPYCDDFGGNVMNATIDLYAYATVQRGEPGLTHLAALDHDRQMTFNYEHPPEIDPGLVLHWGVYRRIVRDFLGGEHVPLRLLTSSDAPAGSGLGSSSTLVVAMLTALAEYFTLPLGEYDIARLAFEIERRDVGLQGGRQDQYAAAFGGFNFMEFLPGDRVLVNPLRVKPWVVSELEASIVLYYTGVSRESAAIIAEQSAGMTAALPGVLEAMHRVKREAIEMKEFLLRGDVPGLARSMQAGWESKKRTASSISNPLLTRVEAVAVEAGAFASKVSGAGGGGFMIFFVDPLDRTRLQAALNGLGGRVFPFHFAQDGANAWRIRR